MADDRLDPMNDLEFYGTQSKWVCPSDRHLQLRAKLNSGWCIRSPVINNSDSSAITEKEQAHILNVMARLEASKRIEQLRVGRLVERLENMRKRVTGNGVTQCMLCSAEFGLLSSRSYGAMCNDCRKYVCQKNCGVETVDRYKVEPIFLCKICSEYREMLKKSNAWFYKEMPDYIKTADSGLQSRKVTSKLEESSDDEGICRKVPNYHLFTERNYYERTGRHSPLDICSNSRRKLPSGTNRHQIRKQSKSKHLAHVHRIAIVATDTDSDGPPETNSPTPSSSPRPSVATPSSHGDDLPVSDARSVYSEVVPNDPMVHFKKGISQHQKSTSKSDSKLADEIEDHNKSTNVNSVQNHNSSSSPISLSNDDEPNSLGILEFTLTYKSKEKQLIVHLLRAKNLKAMDLNGFSDPYVKLHLIPGNAKATKLTSRTVKKSLNPEWNEKLIYHGLFSDELNSKVLRLTVLDRNTMGADFLGETRVELRRLEMDRERTFSVYLDRPAPTDKANSDGQFGERFRGKILISLCYEKTNKFLIVGIGRCSQLVGLDSSGYSDPYVKILLASTTGRTEKNHRYRTTTKRRTLNPEFNETASFPATLEELSRKTLLITVYDRDVCRQDDYIGGLSLSNWAKGDQLDHWLKCLLNPDETFEFWHKIIADT